MANTTLQTISYREHPGKPLEWTLDCLTLGQVNLLVGKNATGKSRALSVISSLAKIIRGEMPPIPECGFDATFIDSKNRTLRYVLRANTGKVLEEMVFLDGSPKLKRDERSLELYYEESATHWVTHEPSESEISAVARKDKKQHPFLLPLHDWAEALRNYDFGEQLGRRSMAIGITAENLPDVNDRDQNMVVGIFRKAKTAYPGFVEAVMADMKSLGYSLLEIDATVPDHMQFTLQIPGGASPFAPGKILALGVRENGIEGMFFQDTISQGMFRALSVLVQVHFSQLSGRAHCIVIDDIGEGLDFERSSQLIEILQRKAKDSKFQLIMATNDQFVMNHVPLDAWSVLQRKGNHVSVRNIHNSKPVFEDFRFIGLSNFSFFEMDFVSQDQSESPQLKLEGISGNE
jgi:predicted ATPase